MIEAACTWPWCCPFKSIVKKTKHFLMNKEEKLKYYHQKPLIQFFLSRICYLLNVFQNPARKPASCWIEKFPANSEKNLLDLAAKQLKWQH